MREHALVFGRDRSLVGVMTEDGTAEISEKDNSTGVLLLTAGLDHHVGPNRIYVKLARRLAAMGFVVLRFGFSGTGDSGPRRDKLPAIKSVIDEAQQAMDCLEHLKDIKKFILIGLCTGAVSAFRVAVVDRRVKGAILINTPEPETDYAKQIREDSFYWRYALFNPHSWMKLLFLRSSYRSVWGAVSLKIRSWLRPKLVHSVEPLEITNELTTSFRSIQERGVQLLICSSVHEFGEQYLREVIRTQYKSLKDAGLLSTVTLRGSDHVVTPLVCQEELVNSASQWMATKR